MTSGRWFELGRIAAVGIIILLFRFANAPLWLLFGAVVFGLYPLAKRGLEDLIHEHKIGTEVFVTIATSIAMAGREYIAGAVLMVIILIAEFIAELNTERARASIRSLIGSVPQTALVRRADGDVSLPLNEVKVGDVVIVREGEKIPIDGVVRNGNASVNQAPITGESIPLEKTDGAQVFAGTLQETTEEESWIHNEVHRIVGGRSWRQGCWQPGRCFWRDRLQPHSPHRPGQSNH